MIRQPDVYSADLRFAEYLRDHSIQLKDGRWLPCRGTAHNAFSFKWRWKMAWCVFIGKYDALKWEDQ
jgi:hypothetical protein